MSGVMPGVPFVVSHLNSMGRDSGKLKPGGMIHKGVVTPMAAAITAKSAALMASRP